MSADAAQLELREVRGPGALSGGVKRFWELAYLLAVTEFKRTYFGTVLGYLWSVARPLLLFAVLVEVFTHVFRFGNLGFPYAPFLLSNMVLFGFFQEATTMAVPSIVNQEGIVRKTQFPRLSIPTAVVLSSLFNLLLNMIVVFVFVLAFGISPQWTWLLVPVVIALMCLITLPVSMIVSSLYPRFRDLGIIWSVFATALFYATPVLYPLERVVGASHTLAKLIELNPFTSILQLSRRWLIDPKAPYPGTGAAGGVSHLLVQIAITLAVCVLAVWVFRREAPRIAEEL